MAWIEIAPFPEKLVVPWKLNKLSESPDITTGATIETLLLGYVMKLLDTRITSESPSTIKESFRYVWQSSILTDDDAKNCDDEYLRLVMLEHEMLADFQIEDVMKKEPDIFNGEE